ncbi:MAG: hypothetical protein Q6352_007855 [Candidatus Freyrarchaeum guaymaensis]|nr:hypothetical protein [Candidatus Sigynarchaeota archaeon]
MIDKLLNQLYSIRVMNGGFYTGEVVTTILAINRCLLFQKGRQKRLLGVPVRARRVNLHRDNHSREVVATPNQPSTSFHFYGVKNRTILYNS